MPRSRITTDAVATWKRLAHLTAAVRREAEGAEGDPFDEAMVAAVVGLAEALIAEADALTELEARLGKLARRLVASE